MPASLELRGIRELKEALVNLPVQLKGQATTIVLDSAYAAADEIRAQYPAQKATTTGNLRKGVKVVVKEIGPVGVAAQVRSTAPHAVLWEFGTQARHTRLGWNRGRMPAPPAPVFIPTMMRARTAMYTKLAAVIEAQGLEVKVGDE